MLETTATTQTASPQVDGADQRTPTSPVEQPASRRRAPVAALMVGGAVSLVGNQLAAVAIPWYVLQTTGSASRTGLVAFFTLLPTVAAMVFGGALADRLGHRRMSVLSDLLSAATVAAIPLLHATVGLPFGVLLGLVFLGALLDAPGGTARSALIPDAAARAGMPLERVNGAFQAIQSLAGLVGPLLAGLLIALMGERNVLWLDAATFLVSAAAVAAFVPAPPRVAAARGRYLEEVREGWRFLIRDPLLGVAGAPVVLWVNAASFAVSATLIGVGLPGRLPRSDPALAGSDARVRSAGLLRDVGDGLRFLWRDRLLRTLALTVALTNLVDAPIAVALVVYVREVLGRPEALGLIWAVFGAGALGGSVLYGAVGHRLPRRTVVVAGFAGTVIPFGVLALTPPLAVAVVAAAAIGVTAGPINPILMTVRQERVPRALRGRVFGAMRAIAWSAMPLGVLAGGIAIEAFGVGATFAVMAACYLAATLWLAVDPAVRRMDPGRGGEGAATP